MMRRVTVATMSISIGFRIEFYDDEDKHVGDATFEDGYRACVVPQKGEQISTAYLKDRPGRYQPCVARRQPV